MGKANLSTFAFLDPLFIQLNDRLAAPKENSMLKAGAAIFCLAILKGCAGPLTHPKVISGSSETVSIEAGAWSNADIVAAAHCDKFGKRAVLVGRRRLSETKVTDLLIYDCKDLASK